MSDLKETSQEILDCIDNIEKQCIRLTHCTKDIDKYDNNETIYDVVNNLLRIRNEYNSHLDLDNIKIRICLQYMEDYKNSGYLSDLIKFLSCFNNNTKTSFYIDNVISDFIYNKLFNKKGEDEDEY